MDIKTRIDELSELEAKSALLWLLYKACPLGGDLWDNCEVFPCRATCEECLLDQANEARNKNFYYPGLPNGDVTTVGNTGDYVLKEARK